jgi:hypothetical protein
MIVFAALALALTADVTDAPALTIGDAFASGADVGSDIDKDGVRDVLVFDAGQRGKRPGLWLVSGKTGVLLRSLPAHPGTLIQGAHFVGDVDGDHVSDFVVTTQTAEGTTSWFAVSSASGKMLWKQSRGAKDTQLVPLGWVGDVDGDGCLDEACREVELVHARHGPERIRLLSGKTGELVATFDVESPLSLAPVDAGDVDGDHCADIAVPILREGRASIGMYSCKLSRWLWIAPVDEHDLHSARGLAGGRDVDGDGVPDVVVASPSDGLHLSGTTLTRDPDRIRVLSGKDGKLVDTREVPSSPEPSSFGASLALVDDVDKDGKCEILVGDGDDGMSGCVWLFSSRGGPARGLVGPEDGSHFGRHVIAAGDLDGDGAGDFLVTQTPAHPGQEGALIACSGATTRLLWRITRKDVDVEAKVSKPVEHVAPAPDVAGDAPAGSRHEPDAPPAGTDVSDGHKNS